MCITTSLGVCIHSIDNYGFSLFFAFQMNITRWALSLSRITRIAVEERAHAHTTASQENGMEHKNWLVKQ